MGKSRVYDGTSVPVDSIANRVTSKGYEFRSIKKIAQRHWDIKPPLRPLPKDAPKLVGVSFGRFTVVGLFNEGNGVWVVRCVCGAFETRRAKAIRNPTNKNDGCENCRQLDYIRSKSANRSVAVKE